jgi:hypothetical protein
VKIYHRRLSGQQRKILQNLCEEEAAGRNPSFLVPIYAVTEVEVKNSVHARTNLQISMSYDGTLGDYLGRKRNLGFNFKMPEITGILFQILESLHYMHSKGFLHGNLNPDKGKLKSLMTPDDSTLYQVGGPIVFPLWFRIFNADWRNRVPYISKHLWSPRGH